MAATQPMSATTALRLVRASVRQLRILANAHALSPAEFERLIAQAEDGVELVLDTLNPPPPPINAAFTVIEGGRT